MSNVLNSNVPAASTESRLELDDVMWPHGKPISRRWRVDRISSEFRLVSRFDTPAEVRRQLVSKIRAMPMFSKQRAAEQRRARQLRVPYQAMELVDIAIARLGVTLCEESRNACVRSVARKFRRARLARVVRRCAGANGPQREYLYQLLAAAP